MNENFGLIFQFLPKHYKLLIVFSLWFALTCILSGCGNTSCVGYCPCNGIFC